MFFGNTPVVFYRKLAITKKYTVPLCTMTLNTAEQAAQDTNWTSGQRRTCHWTGGV